MEYEQFMARVRERTGLDDDRAVRAVRATLSTLGERLAGSQANYLATELPPDLALYVTRNPEGRRWDVGEFLRQIGEREACPDPDQVRLHAQAVLGTVAEALEPDARAKLLAQLEAGIVDLFGVPTTRD
jgi:uncharacterized protein (DUF2267 family)